MSNSDESHRHIEKSALFLDPLFEAGVVMPGGLSSVPIFLFFFGAAFGAALPEGHERQEPLFKVRHKDIVEFESFGGVHGHERDALSMRLVAVLGAALRKVVDERRQIGIEGGLDDEAL